MVSNWLLETTPPNREPTTREARRTPAAAYLALPDHLSVPAYSLLDISGTKLEVLVSVYVMAYNSPNCY